MRFYTQRQITSWLPYFDNKSIGIFFLDVSTGEFLASQGNAEYIDKLLQNFSPSEVLIQKNNKNDFKENFGDYYIVLFRRLDLQKDYAFEILTKHFQTVSLKGFGIADLKEGIIASGAILYYLSETQHNKVQHYHDSTYCRRCLCMDGSIYDRNLELYHSYNPNAAT
jgi:DNA mismatch repair protein MutS